MFDDKSRPLYALCDQIKLNRLLSDDYYHYLNSVAKKTWNKKLPDPVFQKIMEFTECHPRYVYFLCMKLWDRVGGLKKKLTENAVTEAWNGLIEDRSKDTREILSKKSLGQIKLLIFIALGNTQGLSGARAQMALGMSGSAASQAIRILEQEDFVEKTDQGYYIIDPLLKSTLIQYGSDYFL